MVPVIATILDNYRQVIEKQRAKADADQARNAARLVASSKTTSMSRPHPYGFDQPSSISENRQSRRQPPPALDIPQPFTQTQHLAEDDAMEITPTRQTVLTSPPERTTFPRPQLHHHHRSHDGRNAPHRNHIMQPLATAVPSMDAADGFAIRPVRDADRLPSMLPPLQAGNHSQPESPTTPSAPPQHRDLPLSTNRRPRRPSIRQQRSTSGDSDDAIGEESAISGDDANDPENVQPVVEAQTGVSMGNVDDDEDDVLLDAENAPLTLTIPDASEPQETETFNITHRTAMDGSILNTNATPVNGALTFSPVPPAPPVNIPSPAMNMNGYPNFLRNPTSSPGMQAMQPRDEDVLMSLQLLAYVSKYCNLRPHFQATHLVPKLRLNREAQSLGDDGGPSSSSVDEDDEDEEYLQPDDFNTFPLVEKFTVRHHSKDMQYWACVVMRNLCRKDDSRGGIRQCAYYACGKWEEFTRQFAKCRRCRRTKYCSKDCQKNAWVYHRHWCHAPT